jgi:hypothetical protein
MMEICRTALGCPTNITFFIGDFVMPKARNASSDSYDQNAKDSFLTYWEKQLEKKADRCSHCRERLPHDDLVGGHVEVEKTRGYYITPLCRSCNHPDNTDWFEVAKIDLVPAP